MTRVMTLGGVTQDSIIEYSEPETLNLHSTRGTLSYLLLEEGKKVEVTHLKVATGGGAGNSAVCFKRLGFQVSACFKVGNDPHGAMIIEELQGAGVDVSHSITAPNVSTGCSFIVPSLHGDRTVFAYRGANSTLQAADLPLDVLSNYELLYITSLSGESAERLPELSHMAKKKGVLVAINPGISQLKSGGAFIAESLANIDMLLLNSAEAKQLMVSLVRAQMGQDYALVRPDAFSNDIGPNLLVNPISYEEIQFNLLDFFHRVIALGPRTVVVTNGEEGVYVAHQNNVYFQPSLAVKPVNTVGAGDAFSASFVGAMSTGHSVQDAIRWGVVNSRAVVKKQDAKSGLLTKDVILSELSQIDHEALKVFPLHQ